jgi:hypothetical protein
MSVHVCAAPGRCGCLGGAGRHVECGTFRVLLTLFPLPGIQMLQMGIPASLPPILELSRPELKLAGMRIDPDLYARSKMGYYTDLSLVPSSVTVPAPPESCTPVTGYPQSSWINLASWAPDSRHIAFTVRGGAESGWGQGWPVLAPVAPCDECKPWTTIKPLCRNPEPLAHLSRH